MAEYKMARADPRFPVGRTRLETVGPPPLAQPLRLAPAAGLDDEPCACSMCSCRRWLELASHAICYCICVLVMETYARPLCSCYGLHARTVSSCLGPGVPHARARSQTARLMQRARAGVISCAVIMTIATLAVIESAARDLTAGFFHGAPPPLCPSCGQPCERYLCFDGDLWRRPVTFGPASHPCALWAVASLEVHTVGRRFFGGTCSAACQLCRRLAKLVHLNRALGLLRSRQANHRIVVCVHSAAPRLLSVLSCGASAV